MLARLQLRIMLVGTVILLGWVGYLATMTARDVYSLRDRESTVRGLIVAESLADSIGRALGYGIEIDDLTGIDQVFAARLAESQDVVEIVFDDLSGKVRVPSVVPLRQGMSVSAVVTADGQARGKVTVYLRNASLLGALSAPVSAALLILLVVIVAAREAVRYCVHRGPGLRDSTAMGLLMQIAELDFDHVVKEAHLKRLDIRSAWLSTQIRDLNERFMRLFRLIVSLRHTEPSNAERTRLMALANQARGDAKFAIAKPAVERPSSTDVDMRWLVFVATASVSVDIFMIDRLSGSLAYSTALLLALGLIAAWCGYAFVQRWLVSHSGQLICLGGLFVLGATPLAFVLVSLLGGETVQSTGQAATATRIGTRDLGQFAVACLQAMGAGVFFAGLNRFDRRKDPGSSGYEELPIVVLEAIAIVGTSSVLIWGSILGSNGMMLLSSALALASYFFFAISVLTQRDPNADDGPTRTSNGRAATAIGTGFVLSTAISAVSSGVFPGVPIETPELLAWSAVAMGIGFVAQILPKQWPAPQIGILALLANVIVLAGPWSTPRFGTIASMVALTILTYCQIGLLRETARDSAGTQRMTVVRWIVAGGITGFLFFAACLYFGYSASFAWGFSAIGCFILVVVRKTPRAAHAT
jgi:hypothetical protein